LFTRIVPQEEVEKLTGTTCEPTSKLERNIRQPSLQGKLELLFLIVSSQVLSKLPLSCREATLGSPKESRRPINRVTESTNARPGKGQTLV